MLHLLNNNLFHHMLDFLEIQEYFEIFLTSKEIKEKAMRYKHIKMRKPNIYVLSNCGQFEISEEGMKEMKRISDKLNINMDKYKYNGEICVYLPRDHPVLIQAIFNLGSQKATKSLCLFHVIPHKLKKCFKIKNSGGEYPQISANIYRFNLIEKYKKKINEIINSNDKKETESILFQKLLCKHEFIENYREYDDNYIYRFDRRINLIIKNKNNDS